MPKETVHYGWHYVEYTHPGSSDHGPWREAIDRDQWTELVNSGRLDEKRGEHAHSPMLQVFWSRPAPAEVTPFDEDPVGAVQVGLQVSEVEMRRYSEMFAAAPQDEGNRLVLTRGLSRGQVNNLIRVLMRARNAAFGADE